MKFTIDIIAVSVALAALAPGRTLADQANNLADAANAGNAAPTSSLSIPTTMSASSELRSHTLEERPPAAAGTTDAPVMTNNANRAPATSQTPQGTTERTASGHAPVKVAPPKFGRLTSGQIQAVQTVGQAVLGAKATRPRDAAADALKAELLSLGDELEQAARVADLSQGVAASKQHLRPSAERAQRLQSRLARIDSRRRQLQDEAHSEDAERQAQRSAQIRKTDELIREATAALAASDGERLQALRARLKVAGAESSPDAVARSPATDTPTLTTLTRHR